MNNIKEGETEVIRSLSIILDKVILGMLRKKSVNSHVIKSKRNNDR